jgi:hypothetical protein
MGRHALPALRLEKAGEEALDICGLGCPILIVLPASRMPNEDQRLRLLRAYSQTLKS